jgi:hypothetical protein
MNIFSKILSFLLIVLVFAAFDCGDILKECKYNVYKNKKIVESICQPCLLGNGFEGKYNKNEYRMIKTKIICEEEDDKEKIER